MGKARSAGDPGNLPDEIQAFFQNQLRELQLAPEQIAEQGPEELRASLAKVNDALLHPHSFGTVTLSLSPRRRFMPAKHQNGGTIEVGMARLLLNSKALIEQKLQPENGPKLADIGLDSIVKVVGLAGIAAFGMLFVAYYQFYSTIGVRPEDIGVNYSYVLARSVGLALVVLAAAAYGIGGASSKMHARLLRSRASWILSDKALGMVGLVGIAFGVYGLRFTGEQRSAFEQGTFVLLILLGTVLVVGWVSNRGVSTRLGIVSIIMAVPLAFTVGLAVHAHNIGRLVLAGRSVEPLTMWGAPLLDVQAKPVTVQWAGPDGQLPKAVFGSVDRICATDLGRSQSTQFLMRLEEETPVDSATAVSVRLVQLPVAMVAIREMDRDECLASLSG